MDYFDLTNHGLGYDKGEEPPYNQIMEDQIAAQIRYIKREVAELNLMVTEYYATHWRDDETPEGEYFASRSPLPFLLFLFLLFRPLNSGLFY